MNGEEAVNYDDYFPIYIHFDGVWVEQEKKFSLAQSSCLCDDDNDDEDDDNEGDHYYDYEEENNDNDSLIILLLLLIVIIIFTLISINHADTHSTFTNL
ncbi:hypothetical protein LSAT2_027064 [Lamellibrachia satsuma]|nr:hypothetical protein LSAT2_027064 [Lamellibrachia satsuma]